MEFEQPDVTPARAGVVHRGCADDSGLRRNDNAHAIIACALLLSLTGCAVPGAPDMRMGAPPSHYASTPFTAVERQFVTLVAIKNVYEIEVSKLAADRAV